MRTIGMLKSYNFKGRDPEFDRMRTVWQDSGYDIGEVSYITGISEWTLKNWFIHCTTQSPTNYYVEAFYRGMGWFRRGILIRGDNVIALSRQTKPAVIAAAKREIRERRRAA